MSFNLPSTTIIYRRANDAQKPRQPIPIDQNLLAKPPAEYLHTLQIIYRRIKANLDRILILKSGTEGKIQKLMEKENEQKCNCRVFVVVVDENILFLQYLISLHNMILWLFVFHPRIYMTHRNMQQIFTFFDCIDTRNKKHEKFALLQHTHTQNKNQ